MEYSVRLEGDALLDNIQTAYDRAEINAGHAEAVTHDAAWWGPDANYAAYASQDRLHHQLTGEIDAIGRDYRSEAYWMCSDPIAKELVPDFPGFVYFSAQRYLEAALDKQVPATERAIALDHAKQYALTLFHAAQYPARSRLLRPQEAAVVESFKQAAEHSTRAFYGSILGWGAEFIDTETSAAAGLLQDPALSEYAAKLQPKHFKAQELDQPLAILMSSALAVDAYPNTDIVYALPAGGTQHAIVAQMLYARQRAGTDVPPLHYLTISTHSVKPEALAGMVSPSVEQVVRQSNPTDKHVLVCEDNSNSGTTISLAADIIEASFPASCNISIVEFDPKRLEVKNRDLTPVGHVTNYSHSDFTTAVGIVPVTTGKYPDAQLRKIIPLRRQRHAAHDQMLGTEGPLRSYDEIPDNFFDGFDRAYKETLKYCGDLHGYRNPYQVSAAMVRQYNTLSMFEGWSVGHKYDVAQGMARAAIEYPFLPDSVRRQLADSQEVLDYTEDGPWIREGAWEMITELLRYAQEADSQVLIWTKGDGSYYSNPPYIGAEEQQLRFEISGLERRFNQGGFFDSGYGSFLAHPKKTPLLGTRVLPDLRRNAPHVSDIVIVDDSEKNLAEAAQVARRYGYRPHPVNPLVGDSGRSRLDLLTRLAQARYWGPNTAFIVDMDDTLLHEGFRKYHQPRNMALAMLNAARQYRRPDSLGN